jgi:hypothetical protein
MKAVIIGVASFIIVASVGYYLFTAQLGSSHSPASREIKLNPTSAIVDTNATINKMTGYENTALGIAFESPHIFTLEGDTSLRYFGEVKDNHWKLTLHTPEKEELAIYSDAPADLPDCRKIIYKKEIVTNVTITLHKETFDDIADCKSDTPYTGWFALAKSSTNTWFLSLSTDTTDQQHIEELDTNFEKLVRSFRRI